MKRYILTLKDVFILDIIVIGATGRVGQLLMEDLKAQGHHVVGTSRKESDRDDMLKLDLHWQVGEMASILRDFDVVYFVAGSRGKDLLQTDLNGAVRVMVASQAVGINRFIQLSSINALEQERWSGPHTSNLTDYNIAKFFSDHWLIDKTNLRYTILQPSSLTETPATGEVNFNVQVPTENSIADVAQVLADILEFDNTIGKVIKMTNGTTPIKQALAEI